MYKIAAFILNLPWTLVGFFTAIISFPTKVELFKQKFVFVFRVSNFWWYKFIHPGVRAMTHGHVILLNPQADDLDLKHELVHIEQFNKHPLIFPALYFLESILRGYQKNRYENEAYTLSGSRGIQTNKPR